MVIRIDDKVGRESRFCFLVPCINILHISVTLTLKLGSSAKHWRSFVCSINTKR